MNRTTAPATAPELSVGLRRYLYFTAAITGAAVMIVEILGAKMLSPFVGTSHFVWTAQIAVTLVALACEYYAGGKLADASHQLHNDLNAVKVRLIGAATRDAQLRAEQFASGSGVTVGPLRSASQGVFQITRPNSTETADYGSYDTGTVEKVVKAVVTVEYAVARE